MDNKLFFIHGSYYKKNFGDYLLLKRLTNEIEPQDVRLPFSSQDVLEEFGGEVKKLNFRDLRNTKACIFGGGGYLGEPPEGIQRWSIGFLKRHFIPFITCKFFGIPVYVIGAGFGPISTPWLQPIIRYMLNNAQLVWLRDKESVEFAKKIAPNCSIEMVTDLAQDKAFLLDEIASSNVMLPDSKYIGIHVGLVISDDFRLATEVALNRLAREGYQFVFFSDSPGHNSNLISGKVEFADFRNEYSHLINDICYEQASDVIKVIDNSEGVITGKLHVGIVASTLSKPVLSFPLHHKTIRYYRHIGREDCCIESDCSLERAELSIDSFFDVVTSKIKYDLPENILVKHKKAIDRVKGISGTLL